MTKNITISISDEAYIKTMEIRNNRELSGIIDNFLINFFPTHDEIDESVERENTLLDERDATLKRLESINGELALIKTQRIKSCKQQQELVDFTDRSIKNSGIMEDLVD